VVVETATVVVTIGKCACDVVMPPTLAVGSTARCVCSGEWWAGVGPAGGMCADDSRYEFFSQLVGVVVGETGWPSWVFTGLVFAA
jgi:hypothetical protein